MAGPTILFTESAYIFRFLVYLLGRLSRKIRAALLTGAVGAPGAKRRITMGGETVLFASMWRYLRFFALTHGGEVCNYGRLFSGGVGAPVTERRITRTRIGDAFQALKTLPFLLHMLGALRKK